MEKKEGIDEESRCASSRGFVLHAQYNYVCYALTYK